jgi:DNA primase
LRSVRFLFLPPQHDPDSYVRELGSAAFEQCVAQAVPLSRQLIEHAAEGADLSTAEGRARMLAQARPLWNLLPEGALKRQLMPELARSGGLSGDDLLQLWGQTATRAKDRDKAPAGPIRLLRRGTVRVAPAGPSDVAVRLLLQHSDWWEQLGPDHQQLLHDLGGTHSEIVRWLEQQMMDHGSLSWSALNQAMDEQPWASSARALVQAGMGDEEHKFDELRRCLNLLLMELLRQEADSIVSAMPAAEELQRYREIMALIASMKAAATTAP